MFELSNKSIYSILALIELAANYNKKNHLKIKEIAKNQKIPINFLGQLLLILKKNNFVKSIRGKDGGYTLAKSPNKITLIEILQLLEGDLKILSYKKDYDFLNFFFNDLENKIKSELSITLEDLILKQDQYKKNLLYII